MAEKKIGWKTITATVVMCAAVFGFIYKHTVDSYNNRIETKNDTIDLLERENKRLSEEGPVPEAVKKLESQIQELRNQLRPLTMLTKIDQITGRCDMGRMSFGTILTTDFAEAQKLIEEKKFDLALAKADEMEKNLPDFVGATYVRFKVNQAKGYDDETASVAEELISRIPEDNRIEDVYVFLVNHYLRKNEKKKAEETSLKALNLWPEDEKLHESFEQVFGYKPSLPK
jgi:tetratricopeptide (TPR) repeat protein